MGGVVSPQEPQDTEEYDGDFLNRFNEIRNFWNETFKRKAPRRVVPESDFNISTDVITNFAKSCSIYTDEDFKDAIRQASEEDFSCSSRTCSREATCKDFYRILKFVCASRKIKRRISRKNKKN